MRRPTASFSAMFILMAAALMVVATGKKESKSANATTSPQEKEDLPKIFAAEGAEGPPGDWWVAAVPDLNQKEGDNVPVTIVGTRSLTASGRFANLLVAGVTIKNSTTNPPGTSN